MHGLTGGGWKRSNLATVTAVKRPAGETRGKLAAGPNAGQRHRASPRPYLIGSPALPAYGDRSALLNASREVAGGGSGVVF